MKSKLLLLFVLLAVKVFSQVPPDLKFDKNFVESENHWIVMPSKDPSDAKFYIGYIYYDEAANRFSMQQIHSVIIQNGIWQKEPISKNGPFIQVLDGNIIDFAFVPEQALQQMKLEKYPSEMKSYQLEKDSDKKKLSRASTLNGLNRSDLALPILENLYQKKMDDAKLYFELTFAYNALENYKEAIKISNEAEKKGFSDELILKERNYAYIHDNQLDKGAEVLEKNLKNFTTPQYKEESILNTANLYYRNKDIPNTKKWIKIYYQNFPDNGRYLNVVKQLQAKIETGSK